MPYIAPDFDAIRRSILRDIRNQQADADTSADSDAFVRASATASVAEGIYQYLGWILRQIFPDTADSDYLLLHARTRGLMRKPGTLARGSARVSGTPGSILPAGSQIRGETVSCRTSESLTLDESGSGTVSAGALTTGSAANITLAVPAELVSAPMGINSRVVVETLTGGTDEESDASLLERLLDLIRRPPAGGNVHDYRMWALSVPGVSGAYVYPLRRGLGTVDVVVTADSGLAPEEVMSAVQTYIDSVRPVTAKNVVVLSPTIRRVDFAVKIAVTGISFSQASAEVRRTTEDYMNRLQPGQPVIISQVEMLISLIPGVDDRQVQPAENIIAVADASQVEWLQAGSVEVSLLRAAS